VNLSRRFGGGGFLAGGVVGSGLEHNNHLCAHFPASLDALQATGTSAATAAAREVRHPGLEHRLAAAPGALTIPGTLVAFRP
jgi:hypothetical protein